MWVVNVMSLIEIGQFVNTLYSIYYLLIGECVCDKAKHKLTDISLYDIKKLCYKIIYNFFLLSSLGVFNRNAKKLNAII